LLQRQLPNAVLFSCHSRLAFLPSTFAMYTTMLFFSQMLQPPRQHSGKRTFWAIFWVGLGALLGWPFSAAVGLPFALEELLIHNRNQSKKKTVRFRDWRRMRFLRLVTYAIAVLALVLVSAVMNLIRATCEAGPIFSLFLFVLGKKKKRSPWSSLISTTTRDWLSSLSTLCSTMFSEAMLDLTSLAQSPGGFIFSTVS